MPVKTKTAGKLAATGSKAATGSNGWVCQECGLEVAVDSWGNAAVTELFCCDKPMKARRVMKVVSRKAPAAKSKR